MQRTLARAVHMNGIGVHKGEAARVRITPAPCDFGVRFMRTDVVGLDAMVEARYDAVVDTALCTRIANGDGVSISTIEHLMAALAGCGIDNALVELDGPEIPIMDGSSAPFVSAFLGAGVIDQMRIFVRSASCLRFLWNMTAVSRLCTLLKGSKLNLKSILTLKRLAFSIEAIVFRVIVSLPTMRMLGLLDDWKTLKSCVRSVLHAVVHWKMLSLLTAAKSSMKAGCDIMTNLCAIRCWTRLAI